MSFSPNYLGGGFSATFEDLTVTGDLQFGDAVTDTLTVDGVQIIDTTATEALLVRKDGDTGDIFTVDTTNEAIIVGNAAGDTLAVSHDGTDSVYLTSSGVHKLTGGDLNVASNDMVAARALVTNTGLSGGVAAHEFRSGTGTAGQAQFVAGSSNVFLFTESSNKTKNYDHAGQTNPTIFIHSAADPDVDNAQWVGIAHDQTDGVITTGAGLLQIQPADPGVLISGQVGANMTLSSNDDQGMAATLTLGADANRIAGIASLVTGFSSGHTSGNASYGFAAQMTGDANDTDHEYINFFAAPANKTGGASTMTAVKVDSGYDFAFSSTSGDFEFNGYEVVITRMDESNVTASSSASGLTFGDNGTRTWDTGALTNNEEFTFKAPTYAFAGASTLTYAVTTQVEGPPIAGSNATITQSVALNVGYFDGDLYTNDADVSTSGNMFIPGISDGTGAVTARTGLTIGAPTSNNVSLGNQTSTLGGLFSLRLEKITYDSTTLVRTVTDAATLYVEGPPTSGGNVTFTNGPFSVFVDEGDSVFMGAVGVGTETMSAALDVVVADTTNVIGLEVTQNDTTNNPKAAVITNAGTESGLTVSQTGTLAAGKAGLTVSSGTAQTNDAILLSIFSNAANTSGNAFRITDNNTSSTHNVMRIDDHTSGVAIQIDKDANNASDTWAMEITSDNAGAGTPGGIDFSGMSVDEPLVKAVADAITTAGTVSHQIAIDIGGTIYYLVAYTHGS